MNCEQIEELLSAYLDNALSSEEWREVASHLQFCQKCSTLLAEFSRNDILISRLPRVSPDLSLRNRIFSSPEYLELTGTFDISSVAQKDWAVPQLPAKSPHRDSSVRPQLIAISGGRSTPQIVPIKLVTRRRLPFGLHRTSRELIILLVLIAAILLLVIGTGSLIAPKFLITQGNIVNDGTLTPPSSQVASSDFPNKGVCLPHDIGNSKISNLLISTAFPFTMKLNQSYVIEISIVPSTEQGCISNLTVEITKTIVTSATPFGTPGAELQKALGPKMKPYASAILNAGTFKIEPSEPQELPFNQSKIVWDWNITPQQAGKQIISVEIRIRWKALKDDGTGIPISYIIGNPQLNIQVEDGSPSFDWGQVITYVLEVVLSGALLALVTWLSAQIWRRISEKNKRKLSNKRSGRRNRNLKSAS